MILAQPALLVRKARLAHKDPKERPELQVRLVHKDLKAPKVILAQPALLARKARLAHKDPKERSDLKALPAHKVLKEPKAHKA